eukprot:6665982-Pyramimonas_sp.AAC.1
MLIACPPFGGAIMRSPPRPLNDSTASIPAGLLAVTHLTRSTPAGLLAVTHLTRSTPAGLLAVTQLSQLQRLSLGMHANAVSNLIEALAPVGASNCLDLGKCPHVTDQVLAALATSTSRLERLDLSGGDQLSDVGLDRFAQKRALVVMRRLDLTACRRLSGASLATALAAAPLLTHLRLSECPNVRPPSRSSKRPASWSAGHGRRARGSRGVGRRSYYVDVKGYYVDVKGYYVDVSCGTEPFCRLQREPGCLSP